MPTRLTSFLALYILNKMPINSHIIKQIRIAAINVNSLIANHRRFELVHFANEYNHDVIFLSETKLNSSHVVSFKDYNIIRRDRPHAVQGGGTAILIERGLPFEIIDYPSSSTNEILEYAIIKVSISNNVNLFLVSIYARNDNRNLFINEINVLFQSLRLNEDNNFYIIAGDLNARRKAWGDRADNQRGKYVRQWASAHDMYYKLRLITPAFPTFKPARTFLDVCLADSRLIWLNDLGNRAQTLPYDSDHEAISLTFELQNDAGIVVGRAEKGHRYNYKSTKWDKFKGRVAELHERNIPDDVNLSIADIDDHIRYINDIIERSVASTVPMFKHSDSVNKYLNSRIRKLQKNKSKVVSLLHKLHIVDPSARLELTKVAKATLKNLSKALQREFKVVIEKYWVNAIKNIDFRKPDNFYPKINAFFRPKQFSNIGNIHVKTDNDSILMRSGVDLTNPNKIGDEYFFTSRSDKLNIIGAYYESINSPRFLNTNTRFKQVVDARIEPLKLEFDADREQDVTLVRFGTNNPASNPVLVNDALQPFCSPLSLDYTLRNLPNKTSSGLDGIPPIVLKHLPTKLICDLVVIFNNAINRSYFPKAWKEAKVLPILKKGKNPLDPASYRPISLTPSLSKVFESILNDTLVEFCRANKVVPDSQFGFKHHHATTHAIHKILADVNTQVARSQLVGAALLDLEKAFDSVWLNGLLFRLDKHNCPRWLIHMIWEMISGKSFVTWDGVGLSSLRFAIEEGLQQGTVNSPLLFNIFISELPRLFNFNEPGQPSMLSFADDIVVYLSGNRVNRIRDGLEAAVDKINGYFSAWNLRLNPSKCETILFRKPLVNLTSKAKAGSKDFQISTLMPGTNTKTQIPHKKVVKYLGVHVDYLLRGNKHIDIQVEKATNAFLSNSRIFRNKYLSAKTKTILYMLLVRPILSYAIPVWWNFNHTNAERLRCLERKCLRACLGLYRSRSSDWQHYVANQLIYNKAEIPRIDNFLIRITRDYFAKLPGIPNELLKVIAVQDDVTAAREMASGYIVPQTFMSCDNWGLIQDALNIPWLYHWRRNKANKRIALSLTESLFDDSKFKYSKKIPERDHNDFHRLMFRKYWWLDGSSAHIPELQARWQSRRDLL